MFVILFMLLICGGGCSVTQSCHLFSIPWTAALPCPSPSPGVCPSLCPLYWWCHPAIYHPLTPSSPPALNLPSTRDFSNELALHIHKILELQFQHQSFQWVFRVGFLKEWLFWSPCCPRGAHESSPAPQFKGINSCALSFWQSSSQNRMWPLRPLLEKWCLCSLTCCLGLS